MSLIGIIANPSSGKDIRRLVADAAPMDNRLKANIVRRVLQGIAAMGVDEVATMPDRFGICEQAAQDLDVPFVMTRLPVAVTGTPNDTLAATHELYQREASCIVVLGGDGTHRLVARACGDTPLVPISTGTNNAWPQQNEGTLAGIAAALVARHDQADAAVIRETKRLEVRRGSNEEPADIALIDVATYDESFVGAKAIWDIDRVEEIVLASIHTGTIGLSSIGGALQRPTDVPNDAGLWLQIGEGGQTVLAPIAPGLVTPVPIREHRWLTPGDRVPICHRPCMLALDGEREIPIAAGEELTVRLSLRGPRMVDVPATLRAVAATGYFVRSNGQ